jgi:prepilin-type N-terminal cleavage/methylation domain-containing protein
VRSRRGFTLIELLVALAILGTLLSIVVPRYFSGLARADETVLRQNLLAIREAIDQHFADTGRYPGAVEELVQKRYLRSVPEDPITRSRTTWVLVPPPDAADGAIYDVRSGAPGKGRDGLPYAQM